MTFEPGRCLFLQCDISWPELWHERRVLGRRGIDSWYCVETRTGDIFMEQCALGNPDLAGMRLLSAQGPSAVGVLENTIFRFGHRPRAA